MKSEEKFAYVRTQVLLKKYQGLIDSNLEFDKYSKGVQNIVDSLKNNILDLKQMYKKDVKLFSKLSVAETEYFQYTANADEEINQRRMVLSNRNVEEINSLIKKYGKENSYKYIFGANESGNILYAPEGEDITDDVLKFLNNEYKKDK